MLLSRLPAPILPAAPDWSRGDCDDGGSALHAVLMGVMKPGFRVCLSRFSIVTLSPIV